MSLRPRPHSSPTFTETILLRRQVDRCRCGSDADTGNDDDEDDDGGDDDAEHDHDGDDDDDDGGEGDGDDDGHADADADANPDADGDDDVDDDGGDDDDDDGHAGDDTMMVTMVAMVMVVVMVIRCGKSSRLPRCSSCSWCCCLCLAPDAVADDEDMLLLTMKIMEKMKLATEDVAHLDPCCKLHTPFMAKCGLVKFSRATSCSPLRALQAARRSQTPHARNPQHRTVDSIAVRSTMQFRV